MNKTQLPTKPNLEIEGTNKKGAFMELAAPKIDMPDLLRFETSRNHSLSNKLIIRLKEIEQEYNDLKSLHSWNEFVEGFQINLQPKINQTYYLYEYENATGGKKFLSLISPEEIIGNYTFHGKTKLHSDGYFVKIEK